MPQPTRRSSAPLSIVLVCYPSALFVAQGYTSARAHTQAHRSQCVLRRCTTPPYTYTSRRIQEGSPSFFFRCASASEPKTNVQHQSCTPFPQDALRTACNTALRRCRRMLHHVPLPTAVVLPDPVGLQPQQNQATNLHAGVAALMQTSPLMPSSSSPAAHHHARPHQRNPCRVPPRQIGGALATSRPRHLSRLTQTIAEF